MKQEKQTPFAFQDTPPRRRRKASGVERLGAKKITLGSKMLFASQCVVLIHHALDQR